MILFPPNVMFTIKEKLKKIGLLCFLSIISTLISFGEKTKPSEGGPDFWIDNQTRFEVSVTYIKSDFKGQGTFVNKVDYPKLLNPLKPYSSVKFSIARTQYIGGFGKSPILIESTAWQFPLEVPIAGEENNGKEMTFFPILTKDYIRKSAVSNIAIAVRVSWQGTGWKVLLQEKK